jgi:D-3-phosphoglycerate dehydrogenase
VSLQADALALLRANADVVEHGTRETLPGADMAISGGSVVDGAFLDHAGPGLVLVVRHGAGYDTVDVPAATARGILVANVPDGPTVSTAEHTVALLLAVAKRIAAHDRLMRANEPSPRGGLAGTDVRDQVLGVVGCGRIGRRVSEICLLGLQMQVLAYDPYVRVGALPAGVQVVDTLEDVLTRADFVTLHVPLSAATRHLIGSR